MGESNARYALVRAPSASFVNCIQENRPPETIDLERAQIEHHRYCELLEELGLELIQIPPDERFPDGCFVEDTAVVVGQEALILNMGAPSRLGEAAGVKAVLGKLRRVHDMMPPATMDGGDVLVMGTKLYVGLSRRTNEAGCRTLERMAGPAGYEVVPVPIRNILHLKSACTSPGGDHVVVAPGFFDASILSRYRRIAVPPEEAYAANCLAVNGRVLVSDGYPRTRSLLEGAGFETIATAMSEFRKGGGSLTCLSVIL
jgi:dimethylargininase